MAKSGGRHVLFHGLFFILAGLFWGLVVPHTPFPRLALSAHIGFEGTGLLFIAVALLLLTLPNSVGRISVAIILASAWLSWIMLASEVANSWWGANQILSIAAHQAGAPGAVAWRETTVTLAHIVAGIALIIAWIVLILGLMRQPAKTPVSISN